MITLPVLKVTLPSSAIDTLITDLTPAELPYAEAPSPRYFRRWGLQTHDDDLKNNCVVENFSGHTPGSGTGFLRDDLSEQSGRRGRGSPAVSDETAQRAGPAVYANVGAPGDRLSHPLKSRDTAHSRELLRHHASALYLLPQSRRPTRRLL